MNDARADWINKGFFVAEQLIDGGLIDGLLEAYENTVKPYKDELLRQNGCIEVNHFSEIGGLTNTLLDPHCYSSGSFPELADFARYLRTIFASEILQSYFKAAVGVNAPFILAQSMFFDQITTRSHQDCIYLDTIPSGNLVAVWIALQDLNEEHTRFYVYPGSHLEHLQSLTDDESYFRNLESVINSGKYVLESPMLRKGDVLFWHSRLIHGSRHGSVPMSRRLSITGHYIPTGFAYGNDKGIIEGKDMESSDGLIYYLNSYNL